MIQIHVALMTGEAVTSDTSTFFHDSRCKDKGPTSLWEKVPQTCHCQESSFS